MRTVWPQLLLMVLWRFGWFPKKDINKLRKAVMLNCRDIPRRYLCWSSTLLLSLLWRLQAWKAVSKFGIFKTKLLKWATIKFKDSHGVWNGTMMVHSLLQSPKIKGFKYLIQDSQILQLMFKPMKDPKQQNWSGWEVQEIFYLKDGQRMQKDNMLFGIQETCKLLWRWKN